MIFIAQVGISVVLCLLCTALTWCSRPLKTWLLAVIFGISFVLDILGAVFSVNLYPLTALLVLLVAVSAGLWLGRAISIKRLWPFLLVLVPLSALDITQIILTHLAGPAASQSAHVPAGDLYVDFLLFLPGGQNYVLGIGDLWIITAIAEYWRRREAAFWLALFPGALAFIVADGLLQLFPGLDPIALIPFLTAGWLCSLALYRLRIRKAQAEKGEAEKVEGGDTALSDA